MSPPAAHAETTTGKVCPPLASKYKIQALWCNQRGSKSPWFTALCIVKPEWYAWNSPGDGTLDSYAGCISAKPDGIALSWLRPTRWAQVPVLPGIGAVPVDGIAIRHRFGAGILAEDAHPEHQKDQRQHLHVQHHSRPTRDSTGIIGGCTKKKCVYFFKKIKKTERTTKERTPRGI